MNRFAHKHVGQLRECAAWPKHAQQSRKHARRRKNSIVTETVCRNYSFPSFFMFSLCWLYTPPFPQFLSFTLTLFLLHIPLHFAYLWLSPFHYTSPLLNTTCPPPNSLFLSFFFATSFPLSPHYLTLWLDAQWVTPLLKSSEMEGEGREQKKEIVREREKAGENDREKNIENKNGRRES